MRQSEIADALRRHGGEVTAVARELGVNRRTLLDRVAKDPLLNQIREDARVGTPDDRVVEVPPERLGDLTKLLEDRGVDPAEWVVAGLTVNEWGPLGEEQRQLKARLEPR